MVVLMRQLNVDQEFTRMKYPKTLYIPVIKEKAAQMTVVRRPGKSAVALRFSPWSDDCPLKPPLDNLMVDEQNKIMDRQKRSVMIQDIERKLLQEGVYVPLLTMDRFWVFRAWVYPKEVYFNVYQNYFFEETWMGKR